MTEENTQTQTYFATSAFSDPTNIASFLAALMGFLQAPEFGAIIPARYAPYTLMLAGLIGVFLRTFFALRPVAAVAPGNNVPVQVKRVRDNTVGKKGKGDR